MERAVLNSKEDIRPELTEEVANVVMDQQTLVEPNRVTMIVTVRVGPEVDEYRKVTHKWGGQYYFKNGLTCTQEVYQRGIQADQLAHGDPRSKLD